MEDVFLSSVGSLGFPIVVCFYLLHRVTTSIDNLNKQITRLNIKIDALSQNIITPSPRARLWQLHSRDNDNLNQERSCN